MFDQPDTRAKHVRSVPLRKPLGHAKQYFGPSLDLRWQAKSALNWPMCTRLSMIGCHHVEKMLLHPLYLNYDMFNPSWIIHGPNNDAFPSWRGLLSPRRQNTPPINVCSLIGTHAHNVEQPWCISPAPGLDFNNTSTRDHYQNVFPLKGGRGTFMLAVNDVYIWSHLSTCCCIIKLPTKSSQARQLWCQQTGNHRKQLFPVYH